MLDFKTETKRTVGTIMQWVEYAVVRANVSIANFQSWHIYVHQTNSCYINFTLWNCFFLGGQNLFKLFETFHSIQSADNEPENWNIESTWLMLLFVWNNLQLWSEYNSIKSFKINNFYDASANECDARLLWK